MRKKIFYIVVGFLLIIILALASLLFLLNVKKVVHEGYQAVFLNNGQVYFGKIIAQDNNFVKLNDIYYLQLNQDLQNQGGDILNQPDMSLIKLGNELHGPEDEMEIILNNILFIENLARDSKVLKAIRNYKND